MWPSGNDNAIFDSGDQSCDVISLNSNFQYTIVTCLLFRHTGLNTNSARHLFTSVGHVDLKVANISSICLSLVCKMLHISCVCYLPPSTWAPWLLRGPASPAGNAPPFPCARHRGDRDKVTCITPVHSPVILRCTTRLGTEPRANSPAALSPHRWQQTDTSQLQVELTPSPSIKARLDTK